MSQEQRPRGPGIVILLGAVAGAGALAAWFFRRQARDADYEPPRQLPARAPEVARGPRFPEPPEVVELGPPGASPEDAETAGTAAEVASLAMLAETAPAVEEAQEAAEPEPVRAEEPLAPEADLAETAAAPEETPAAEVAEPADLAPVPAAEVPVEGEPAEPPEAPEPSEVTAAAATLPADEAPVEGEPAPEPDETLAEAEAQGASGEHDAEPEAPAAVTDALAEEAAEPATAEIAEPEPEVSPQADAEPPADRELDTWTTSAAAFSDVVPVDGWSTLPLAALQDVVLPPPEAEPTASGDDADFERLIAEVEASPVEPSPAALETAWEPVPTGEADAASSMDDVVRTIFGPGEDEPGPTGMPDADAVRRLGEVLGDESPPAAPAESPVETPDAAPAGDDLTAAIEQLFEEADRGGTASQPQGLVPGAADEDDVVRSAFASLADEDPGATSQVQRPSFDDRATAELPSLRREATTPEADPEATHLLEEGNAFFNVGQYQLAIQRYSEALERDNGLVAAVYNRANAYARTEQYDDARRDYDRAIELVPDDADTLNNRGMVHLYQARFGQALADFERALAIAPGDVTVRVNRGLTRLQLGRPAEALEDFRAGVERAPNDPAAHYGAAQASAVLGDRDESVRSLERVFSLEPEYVRDAAGDPMLRGLDGYEPFHRLLRTYGA